eukprot:1481213-Lingulodinium_polyedra.AAC.1
MVVELSFLGNVMAIGWPLRGGPMTTHWAIYGHPMAIQWSSVLYFVAGAEVGRTTEHNRQTHLGTSAAGMGPSRDNFGRAVGRPRRRWSDNLIA